MSTPIMTQGQSQSLPLLEPLKGSEESKRPNANPQIGVVYGLWNQIQAGATVRVVSEIRCNIPAAIYEMRKQRMLGNGYAPAALGQILQQAVAQVKSAQ